MENVSPPLCRESHDSMKDKWKAGLDLFEGLQATSETLEFT